MVPTQGRRGQGGTGLIVRPNLVGNRPTTAPKKQAGAVAGPGKKKKEILEKMIKQDQPHRAYRWQPTLVNNSKKPDSDSSSSSSSSGGGGAGGGPSGVGHLCRSDLDVFCHCARRCRCRPLARRAPRQGRRREALCCFFQFGGERRAELRRRRRRQHRRRDEQQHAASAAGENGRAPQGQAVVQKPL